jgi:flagellar protein FliO/FliZ
MNYLWETFKITFYLLMIIGFILTIYYFLKNKFNLNNSRQMEIIDTMRLANGETIYLVKVFDEIVMLGGSKEELNYLKSWAISDLNIEFEDFGDNNNSTSNFKNTFKKLLGKEDNQEKSNTSDQDD